jgi:hypothetical protein
MWLVNRDFFDEDFRILNHFGKAASPSEIFLDAQGLRFDYRKRSSILRMSFKLRLSGKRVIRIANVVFGVRSRSST